MSLLVDDDCIVQFLRLTQMQIDERLSAKVISFIPPDANDHVTQLNALLLSQSSPNSPPPFTEPQSLPITYGNELFSEFSSRHSLSTHGDSEFVKGETLSAVTQVIGHSSEGLVSVNNGDSPSRKPSKHMSSNIDSHVIKREEDEEYDSEDEESKEGFSSTSSDEFVIEKNRVLSDMPKQSILSSLITKKKTNVNLFADPFAVLSAKGDPAAINFTLWIPFIDPQVWVKISIKRGITVEEAIGFALYTIIEEKLGELPILEISAYNLRIVEDDGEIDNDFPAIDRSRKLEKFSFESFALCYDPRSIKQPQLAVNVSQRKDSATPNLFLKVHVYSTLEVKQTTTVNVHLNMLMSEVLEITCRKRKIENAQDYTLKMADTKTDVPLHKTVGELNINEICLLKKERGFSAGDIFLRPPDEVATDESYQPNYISPNEYVSMYKKYQVFRKGQVFGGRQERSLAIDGEYVHIIPSENRNIYDSIKTQSYHISDILDCRQLQKGSNVFRLKGIKNQDIRLLEFEAMNVVEASEICMRIDFLKQISKDHKMGAASNSTIK